MTSGWHVEKGVPLAMLAAVAIQAIGLVWWASSVNSRVAQLEVNNVNARNFEGRIIRLETILERIDRKLDRIAP